MNKTLDDYMYDPEIVNEPSPTMRELYAIRLMIHDETKDMSPEEHTVYVNERAERFLARQSNRTGNQKTLGDSMMSLKS